MTAIPKTRQTATEYLAIERQAKFRSEFYDGEMFAMAGATREHTLIVANLVRMLGDLLKDRPCEVYPIDLRVGVPSGLYTYPDVIVVCGTPEFEDNKFDTLRNPTVLIEVLSEPTADYDRGTKFKHYRQISALREYVLVDPAAAQVEHFILSNGQWALTDFFGLDKTLALDSIGCRVPLTEVYRKVTFATDGQFPAD